MRVKLKAYLGEHMRKWEPTFPEELWVEFARLTKWKGTVTKRPKYWGKLVNELVYEYLDPDVAKWLQDFCTDPRLILRMGIEIPTDEHAKQQPGNDLPHQEIRFMSSLLVGMKGLR